MIWQTSKNEFLKGHIVSLILMVCILFGIGGYLIGAFISGTTKNSSKTTVFRISPTASPNVQNEPSVLSNPVISPQRDFYVRFQSSKASNNYNLKIIVGGFKVHAKAVGDDIDSVGVIWSGTVNENYMKVDIASRVTWSPKTNQLAIFLPGKVRVYNYAIGAINDPTLSPVGYQIILKRYKEIDVEEQTNIYDYPLILFSGDGTQLYYSNISGIKILLPEEKTFSPQTGYHPSSIYPIPNQTGIAYWISGSVPDYKKHQFVIDFGYSHITYAISSSFSIDSPKQLELSPDLKKACIGWESSMSRGSLVVDLKTGQEVVGGVGCINWINNTQIIIAEPSSYTFATGINTTYYLVDLDSKKKTYLYDNFVR
jgi:hypothetical protein